MKLFNFYQNLKERINLLKLKYEKSKTLKILKKSNDEYLRKHPRLAIFAFDPIGTEISVFGLFVKQELENLRDCVFNKIDVKNSICLDVGANIGNHTLNFSEYFKYVYAFEPHPETFQLLKFNARKSKNIKVFEFGLSNINDELLINHSKYVAKGNFSLLADNNLKPIKNSDLCEQFNIKVKKFDDLLESITEDISFIKLDVEDYEINVLQGMSKTLQLKSPIIFFEQYQNQFISNGSVLSSPVIDFLKNNNYNFFYELSFSRKWRFSSNFFPFLNKFIKIFESIFIGMPKRINKLIYLDKFEKKDYSGIIASKHKLD
tara:strand:+ start:1790 stop:2743 length:954 start_codon:yes stop_codon:yes gene_type:complete